MIFVIITGLTIIGQIVLLMVVEEKSAVWAGFMFCLACFLTCCWMYRTRKGKEK